jgi:hypothetical protein
MGAEPAGLTIHMDAEVEKLVLGLVTRDITDTDAQAWFDARFYHLSQVHVRFGSVADVTVCHRVCPLSAIGRQEPRSAPPNAFNDANSQANNRVSAFRL